MLQRITAYLLHVANGSKPTVGRQEFYDLKRRLVERHGHSDGSEDVQEITKECWNCNGTGRHPDSWAHDKRCWRCSDGIHQRFWVRLMRWEWRGYLFHLPGPKLWMKPDLPVTIRGYIQHRTRGVLANETRLWLYLLHDRRAFWLDFTGHAYGEWQWWPLTNLQRYAMPLKAWASKWRKRPCSLCGKGFRRPFQSGIWFICRRCERQSKAQPIMDDIDGIPF